MVRQRDVQYTGMQKYRSNIAYRFTNSGYCLVASLLYLVTTVGNKVQSESIGTTKQTQ